VEGYQSASPARTRQPMSPSGPTSGSSFRGHRPVVLKLNLSKRPCRPKHVRRTNTGPGSCKVSGDPGSSCRMRQFESTDPGAGALTSGQAEPCRVSLRRAAPSADQSEAREGGAEKNQRGWFRDCARFLGDGGVKTGHIIEKDAGTIDVSRIHRENVSIAPTLSG